MGLVGLGGLGFLIYIKLNIKNKIDIILVNGVECEFKLILDYEVMMESLDEFIKGLIYVMKVVGVFKGVIVVKKKYVELVERICFFLNLYIEYDIKVVLVGNYYL